MMAASKPTSWLSSRIHFLFYTESSFGTLAGGLGCFPLDHGPYRPQTDSLDTVYGIRSLIGQGIPKDPYPIQ